MAGGGAEPCDVDRLSWGYCRYSRRSLRIHPDPKRCSTARIEGVEKLFSSPFRSSQPGAEHEDVFLVILREERVVFIPAGVIAHHLEFKSARKAKFSGFGTSGNAAVSMNLVLLLS